ncbi:restriction endonuclease subunit S [Deinococcus arenicola]|uniref:Restriction endonuclease subunit S n=1 Tax=Deinococcus arenicola TaxID=2994950 RepID=A0ABU4DNE1_9DEIO|nr:restriction endonuclease subunit S [Deinococcus sp. ZS9-10]MDV6373400.1 restriction endonuclease subunit S [Deinococcus sp. ZS9-10]
MRESWPEVTLGDVITLKRGYDLPNNARRDGTVPIVSSSGITGYHDEAKIDGPGVVTGRYGTLGEVFLITERFWPLNTTLYVQDFKGNDPAFISYFLRTLNLASQNTAGAVPGLNRNALHMLRASIPPLPTQRKIAAILSAYDDLIENNTRRVQVLEDMARALYREWFVEYRYPGHETAEFIEDEQGRRPKGWEWCDVGDLVVRIPVGKKYDQKSVLPEGRVPVFDQGRSGIIGYHNDNPGVIASHYRPVITFANHTCYQRLVLEPFSAIQNVLPFVPHPSKGLDIFWLHYTTHGVVQLNDYKGHWPEFAAKTILTPQIELTKRFGEFAKPLEIAKKSLLDRNANLRRTRDLLLPRLVSGELDVSELDIRGAAEGITDEVEAVA